MKKVGFFKSIHLKFVLIYVLLIFLAMQIIGVYFVQQLEEELVSNFESSLTSRVDLVQYSLQEEFLKERTEEMPTLEQDVNSIINDLANMADIREVQVVDSSRIVVGTSAGNQGLIGQKTTNDSVKKAFLIKKGLPEIYVDQGERLWVYTVPILDDADEVLGAVYVIAEVETVYKQMGNINEIFATGTFIALILTAILGVFLARTITRPISDMSKQAEAMAKGNFSRKVKVYGYDEIGELAMNFNNLTKRLQEAQATTEGERRKLSSVLSYMTDGVIATDRKGKVILINDPAAKQLKVERDQVLSNSIVTLLGLEDEYTFDELLNEQESVILDYSSKDQPYILRANFSVIQKETGHVNGLITVLHDITEQEKIDMDRREFVANVSHELRTPLTTMRSYLEALAEGAMDDPTIAPQFLKVTQDETERMIRLVNDLLQLSKMDSRDYYFNKEWIPFIRFFDGIIDRFEMSKAQHVTFKRELPDEQILVEIDPDKLTQVIDNIISNALKYSPDGGTVTFGVDIQEEFIVISIKDQGMGIPKDNLDKIFERFYRVDKARSRQMGGTGLGLAIAKEMIHTHGGDIWADSKEGEGTTIFFTLPYESTQEDEWE
ncbi:histidine kinase [Bacillus coahuilensis p1.1.43]|uniref:histidine kinase n=1 Tax=Bacillus coahuilensis p1.1.43 TaxID=1150625 RepID=A0A147KCH8_9BACI|nr:cell wall metabolism sensor histidine kinase WalK [Bacillus coahuilensis]KUP09395.1 histidine kinase [Bacillus coahuilensis p1.1.43]